MVQQTNHKSEPDVYSIPNKKGKADMKPQTQHTVITEDEYAVPNKTIALQKAAARQNELTKEEANGIDNSTYGEAWNMKSGQCCYQIYSTVQI